LIGASGKKAILPLEHGEISELKFNSIAIDKLDKIQELLQPVAKKNKQ